MLWHDRRGLRSENELIEALGMPVIAARPLLPRPMCRLLMENWIAPGRGVLPVVSAAAGEGRTRVAAELAKTFSDMGEPTLAIDADFRAPGLHKAFGLDNRGGLADFLSGRGVRLAQCADNLSVLVAGRASDDPLELLSRPRLQELLAAAVRRYRVVLVDTPAAARGPDMQLFAAFGGGALVVAKRPAKPKGLSRLRELLSQCKAQVVGTVLAPA
jgi:protein-tyrosine kinase